MTERFFFPQASLDAWIVDGKIELDDGELTVLGALRRFRVEEAVRVLVEVTGVGDSHGLLGKVKSKEALVAKGAELVETSMIIGDLAYDVVPGWMGTPSVPFEVWKLSAPDGADKGGDEALLRSLGGE